MFKKILLVMPEHASFYPMIIQALDSMGIKHKLFDNRRTNFFEKILFLLSKISPQLKMLKIELINLRLLKKVIEYKPNLVLVIKGENLNTQTIKKIKNVALIVNWFPDFLQNFKNIRKQIKSYSLFMHADRYEVKKYRKMGYKNFYLLPWAGMKIKSIPKKKEYDVVFIGTYNKKREEKFAPLKNLNFKIWGDSQWGKSILASNYMGKWLSPKEVIEVLKKSKIVVNLHQNKSNLNTMANLRVYEATSCKALLISDYWQDLSKFYRIGKEIIIFRKNNDLVNKVKFYLKNELLRERIANAGYLRTNKEHTYEIRLSELEKYFLK